MTIRLAAAIAAIALLTACSGDQPTTEPSPPAAEPTAEPTEEPVQDDEATMDEPPVGDSEVDFASRDLEGEPAPAGLIDTIEGMSLPDGAVQVINASMVRFKKVYYVVAAVADTPDGVQILTYLHAPWDQSDIDGAGITEPLNFAAQQWAPLAGASDDDEAYEIGERLIVERPVESELIAQLEEASEELDWDSDKCVEAVPFQLWVYDPELTDDEDAFGEAYQAAVEFCETLD